MLFILRTPEFSELMKENERLMVKFMEAEEGSRALFLTGSGTSAMEAAVMNLFTKQDRLLIVNGGSFGAILHYPIAIGFFVVAVGVVIVSLLNQRKINKAETANAGME